MATAKRLDGEDCKSDKSSSISEGSVTDNEVLFPPVCTAPGSDALERLALDLSCIATVEATSVSSLAVGGDPSGVEHMLELE